MRKFLLLALASFTSLTSYSQNQQYDRSVSWDNLSTPYFKVARDKGLWMWDVIFTAEDVDPGPGVTDCGDNLGTPIVLCKYDSTFALERVMALGPFAPTIMDVEEDREGFLYVSFLSGQPGGFVMDFDPSPATYNITTADTYDCILVKYDQFFNPIWHRVFSSTNAASSSFGLQVDVSADGRIFLAGTFIGAFDLDPGAGTFIIDNLAAGGVTWTCMAVLDEAGNFVRGHNFQGESFLQWDQSWADDQHRFRLGIIHTGSLDLDPAAAVVSTPSTASGAYQYTLVTYSNTGAYVRHMTLTASAGDAVFLSGFSPGPAGHVHLGGLFNNGTLDLDAGAGTSLISSAWASPTDLFFVAEYDSLYNLVNPQSFLFPDLSINSQYISVSPSGKILFTGQFFPGTYDLDPGAAVANYTSSAASYSSYYLILDNTGAFDQAAVYTCDEAASHYAGWADDRTFYTHLYSPNAPSIDLDPTGVTELSTLGFHLSRFTHFPCLLRGTVFHDDNANQTRDAGEPGVPGVILTATPGPRYAATDADGNYSLYANTGNYTLSVASTFPYHQAMPASVAATVLLNGDIDSLNDFALVPQGSVGDVEVFLTSVGISRPGWPVNVIATLLNQGTLPTTDTLFLVKDSLYQFSQAVPVPAFQNGDSSYYLLNGVPPLNLHSVTQTWLTDTLAAAGTPVISWVSAENPTDPTPPNNHFALIDVIRASLDPNFIEVDPDCGITQAEVAAGEYLDYVIHFQNTGTDTAFKVVVVDTLDPATHLLSSLQFIVASHPVQFEVRGNGVLVFTFNSILLPDSNTNELASHGAIHFRVKPQPTLVNGDFIRNQAGIYFDYNAPVFTNETEVKVGGLDLSLTSAGNSITAAASGGTAPYSFSLDGSPFGSASTFTGVSTGYHLVQMHDASGCTISELINVGALIQVSDPSGPVFATLLPNPAATAFTVRLSASAYWSLSLLNSLGQEVLHTAGDSDQFLMNVESLPAGCYHLRLSSTLGNWTHRVVVTH